MRQCLHTDFVYFSPKFIIYIYKKVCSLKQFDFPSMKVSLKRWEKVSGMECKGH